MKNSNLSVIVLEEPNKTYSRSSPKCMSAYCLETELSHTIVEFLNMVSLLTEAEILYHAASISEAL